MGRAAVAPRLPPLMARAARLNEPCGFLSLPRGNGAQEMEFRTRYPGLGSSYLPVFPAPRGTSDLTWLSSPLQSRGGGSFALRFPEIQNRASKAATPISVCGAEPP